MKQVTYSDQAWLIFELWQDYNRRSYVCHDFQMMTFKISLYQAVEWFVYLYSQYHVSIII